MSLIAIPRPVDSERKRSRNVCVVSSRLPDRNGAKRSGGGSVTPGGRCQIMKANLFPPVLVTWNFTLPGAIDAPAVSQASSLQRISKVCSMEESTGSIGNRKVASLSGLVPSSAPASASTSNVAVSPGST